MLNRTNARRQLETVNMLIRALADEMAAQRNQSSESTYSRIPQEMEEALYQLRLRKLLISALVDSSHAGKVARH